MGTPVLILGESGVGKSTSLRNLNPDDCILVQAVKKRLPFKGASAWKPWDRQAKTGSVVVTDQSQGICDAIMAFPTHYGKKIIIVDDFQYVMANEFMRRGGETGFGKFTDIAKHAWDIVMTAQAAPDNVTVYILAHTQTDDKGITRCKTVGRLLDEKITLEGLFTIVMKAVRRDGNYYFTTQNDGADTIKTPMGMFDSELIDNDLNFVNQAINAYYSEQ